MKKNNVVKIILISLITLAVGYAAVAIPFGLFNMLSPTGARLFFIIELSLYAVMLSGAIIFFDKRERKQKRQEERHIKRREKIKDVYDNWYNVAA